MNYQLHTLTVNRNYNRVSPKMDDSLIESAFEDDGSDFDVPAKASAKAVVGSSLRSDLFTY